MFDSFAHAFHSLAAQPFNLLHLIYLVAIAAEAMSGALAAGRRSMDFFGVAVIAFVTALGGGTIRDLVRLFSHCCWSGNNFTRQVYAPSQKHFPNARCFGLGGIFIDRLQRCSASRLPNRGSSHVRYAHWNIRRGTSRRAVQSTTGGILSRTVCKCFAICVRPFSGSEIVWV
jgi:hypothetical protein